MQGAMTWRCAKVRLSFFDALLDMRYAFGAVLPAHEEDYSGRRLLEVDQCFFRQRRQRTVFALHTPCGFDSGRDGSGVIIGGMYGPDDFIDPFNSCIDDMFNKLLVLPTGLMMHTRSWPTARSASMKSWRQVGCHRLQKNPWFCRIFGTTFKTGLSTTSAAGT